MYTGKYEWCRARVVCGTAPGVWIVVLAVHESNLNSPTSSEILVSLMHWRIPLLLLLLLLCFLLVGLKRESAIEHLPD